MGDIWSCNGRSCIETGYGSVVYGRLKILERMMTKLAERMFLTVIIVEFLSASILYPSGSIED